MRILVLGEVPNVGSRISRLTRHVIEALEGHDVVVQALGLVSSNKLLESAKKSGVKCVSTLSAQDEQILYVDGDNVKVLDYIGGQLIERPGTNFLYYPDKTDLYAQKSIDAIVEHFRIDLTIIIADLQQAARFASQYTARSRTVLITWAGSDEVLYDVDRLSFYDKMLVIGEIDLENAESISLPVDSGVFKELPPEEIVNLRAKFGLPENAFVILSVARNTTESALMTLIDTLESILEHESEERPIHLLIKTTKENYALSQRTGLLEQAEERDVLDRVHVFYDDIPGTLTDEEMNELYNVADVIVSVSQGGNLCFAGTNHMFTVNGLRRVSTLSPGMRVADEKGWSVIYTVRETKSVNSAFEIRTELGDTLVMTGEHALLTENGLMTVKDLYDEYRAGRELPKLLLPKIWTYEPPENFEFRPRLRKNRAAILRNKKLRRKKEAEKKLGDYLPRADRRGIARSLLLKHFTGAAKSYPHSFGYLMNQLKRYKVDGYPHEYFLMANRTRAHVIKALEHEIQNRTHVDNKYALTSVVLLRSAGRRIKLQKYRTKHVVHFDKKRMRGKDYIKVGISWVKWKKVDSRFFNIVSDSNMVNLMGYPVSNCLHLAEGVVAGTAAISTRYGPPKSWGKEVLIYLDGPTYYSYESGEKRMVVDTRDLQKQILDIYRYGYPTDLKDKLARAKDIFNKEEFALKLRKTIVDLSPSYDESSIPVPVIGLAVPREAYIDEIRKTIIGLNVENSFYGFTDEGFKTSSISYIFSDVVNALDDNQVYVLVDLRAKIKRYELKQLYEEYEQNGKLTVAGCRGANINGAITVKDGSVENGNDIFILTAAIGTGKEFKELELFKTDNLVIFKGDVVLSRITFDHSTAVLDQVSVLDFYNVLATEEGYETKFVVPGLGVYEALLLSKYIRGAWNKPYKVVVPYYITWAYPDVSHPIGTLDELIRKAGSEKWGILFIPDASPATVEWKLGKVEEATDLCAEVKEVIFCKRSSDISEEPSRNVVVIPEIMDDYKPKVKYAPGLTTEQARFIFKNAKINHA